MHPRGKHFDHTQAQCAPISNLISSYSVLVGIYLAKIMCKASWEGLQGYLPQGKNSQNWTWLSGTSWINSRGTEPNSGVLGEGCTGEWSSDTSSAARMVISLGGVPRCWLWDSSLQSYKNFPGTRLYWTQLISELKHSGYCSMAQISIVWSMSGAWSNLSSEWTVHTTPLESLCSAPLISQVSCFWVPLLQEPLIPNFQADTAGHSWRNQHC